MPLEALERGARKESYKGFVRKEGSQKWASYKCLLVGGAEMTIIFSDDNSRILTAP